MLKAAILYKKEIEKKFAEQLYTDDYFWYTGYGTCNEIPNIELIDGDYKWAIVNKNDDVIGYFAYRIDSATDTVLNFGLYSFVKGNPLIGRDTFNKLEELISEHRRIEWRMIGGNPVQKHYDKLCDKYHGHRVCLHQVTKDIHGNYHDEYIYEIIKKENGNKE